MELSVNFKYRHGTKADGKRDRLPKENFQKYIGETEYQMRV